ncbi:hypothetical protein Tco_0649430 [Tanacetum coccineum]
MTKRRMYKRAKEAEYLAPKSGCGNRSSRTATTVTTMSRMLLIAPRSRSVWNPRQANMVEECDMIAIAVDKDKEAVSGHTLQQLISRVKEIDRGGEIRGSFAEALRESMELDTSSLLPITSSKTGDMWGEAILTATYLLNKIPPKHSTLVVSLLYEIEKPDIQKNTVMESRNASFFENIFPCLSKGTGSSSRLDDKVLRDKRQRDDNDLQDERQDQTDEEEVNQEECKRARNEKSTTSDIVRTLGGPLYLGSSSKQTVIAKSTMESEFIALDKCGEEAEWLRQFYEIIKHKDSRETESISFRNDSDETHVEEVGSLRMELWGTIPKSFSQNHASAHDQ